MLIYYEGDYNPEPKEHCRRSCGNMNISFPFGLEEGCFGNEKFRLNCTAAGDTLFSRGDIQYRVTGISIEDGTLNVTNMPSNASTGKEMIIVSTDEGGGMEGSGPVEDLFDFSMVYDIVIRWAVIDSTCQQASQNITKYACRSENSYCLNVTHGKIFMGYRCKCSRGFKGNPYILEGCTGTSGFSFSMLTALTSLVLENRRKVNQFSNSHTYIYNHPHIYRSEPSIYILNELSTDIDECSLPNNCNGICRNTPGSYECSTKQRNLLLGKSQAK